MENTPHAATPFCTNCGNSVSEHAIACLSCGARPTGHKKFCRQCGIALNPEQIMCIQCRGALANNRDMNEATKSYSIRSNRLCAGHSLVIAICVTWLILGAVWWGFDLINLLGISERYVNLDYVMRAQILSMIIIFLNAFVTIPAYWIVYKDVLTFIDIKSSVGR